MSKAAGSGGQMRKKYKQLPFEQKKPPRGRLLCESSHLRVEPVPCGAMGPAQLRDICTGLLDNPHVCFLDLDGNNVGMEGLVDEGESALAPLVELACKNKTLRGLDISNNNLSFDDQTVLSAIHALIMRSNLTQLIIGGNMDMDGPLVDKLANFVLQSRRRWRSISVGSLDGCYREVENLKRSCRQSTAAAERSMIEAYFAAGDDDECAEEELEQFQDGTVVDEQAATQQSDGAAAATTVTEERLSGVATPAAAALKDVSASANVAKKREYDATWQLAGSMVKEVPKKKKPRAAPKPKGPEGASDERCKAFNTAFNEIRQDEPTVDKADVLAQISKMDRCNGFGPEEMEYYLQILERLNCVMIKDGTIYII